MRVLLSKPTSLPVPLVPAASLFLPLCTSWCFWPSTSAVLLSGRILSIAIEISCVANLKLGETLKGQAARFFYIAVQPTNHLRRVRVWKQASGAGCRLIFGKAVANVIQLASLWYPPNPRYFPIVIKMTPFPASLLARLLLLMSLCWCYLYCFYFGTTSTAVHPNHAGPIPRYLREVQLLSWSYFVRHHLDIFGNMLG